jgi:UDPglucose 6-dehydrogenase
VRICVQGQGHLGSVTAACLSSLGHEVIGLDFDEAVIANLRVGIAPVFEPGLEPLLRQGLAAGTLAFTCNADAARAAEVLWIAYDTPLDDQDQSDVRWVFAQLERTLSAVRPHSLVLVSSQLPVGSVRRLEQWASMHCAPAAPSIAYCAENLRLGKAVGDFLHPERIVVGVRSDADSHRLSGLLSAFAGSIEWMSIESAEMTKHAINAWFAASVAFINEVASICEAVGADAKDVERGLKSEPRIGARPYLAPGEAFAGGTLARDVAYLNRASAMHGLSTPLLCAVLPSNESHKRWARNTLSSLFPDLSCKTVAVWGLTYKPGTDTLRRSAAVELCDWLIRQGATVRVHDPMVKALPERWRDRVMRHADPLQALSGAHALVIGAHWPQYRDIPPESMLASADLSAVLDANRFLPHLHAAVGASYRSVGMPGSAA